VGTLVTFRPRAEDAAAKTEAILNKIGELYQKKQKAKEELPGVLAQMLEAGENEMVLRAVMLWGSGEMEAHEVLVMLEEYAAVAGIQLVGNRPF
jgi:hypothetical protein